MYNSLTITLTDTHAIDGWVEAANRNGSTPELIAAELLNQHGTNYAELFDIGIITSASFMARFTPDEYRTIMMSMGQSQEIAGLVSDLTSTPKIYLNDPRLIFGLQKLVDAGLLNADRIPQLLYYARPQVQSENDSNSDMGQT